MNTTIKKLKTNFKRQFRFIYLFVRRLLSDYDLLKFVPLNRVIFFVDQIRVRQIIIVTSLKRHLNARV